MWYRYYSSKMNCFEINCSEVKRLADHKSELMTFLRRGNELFEHLVEEAADRWQLAAPEMRILLFLDRNPELDTARDVAIQCGMSKASVSGNVLKLATRGLLTVDVDLKDRRFQHLTITELAAPILQDARKIFLQADAVFTEMLNEEERNQLLNILRKLNGDIRFHTTSETGKD